MLSNYDNIYINYFNLVYANLMNKMASFCEVYYPFWCSFVSSFLVICPLFWQWSGVATLPQRLAETSKVEDPVLLALLN